MQVLELDSAFDHDDLPSAKSFFQSRSKIEASGVYKFIHGLPKGAGLHLHASAMTSIDWVISNITYRENLYCCNQEAEDILVFGWFDAPPVGTVQSCSGWKSVASMREEMGVWQVDKILKTHLSIAVEDPEIAYPNINTVWVAFVKRFKTLKTLFSYKNLVKDYFYQGLKEFSDDGVQYLEVRSSFAPICEAVGPECKLLDILQTVAVYKEAADQVKF